jgi:hypothetical protein
MRSNCEVFYLAPRGFKNIVRLACSALVTSTTPLNSQDTLGKKLPLPYYSTQRYRKWLSRLGT